MFKICTFCSTQRDYNLNFANLQFSRAYAAAANFGLRHFGMDELITRSNISPPEYKTLYPLFVFDVTKQNEKLKTNPNSRTNPKTVEIKDLKTGVTTVYPSTYRVRRELRIKTIFNEVCPAGNQAYAVVISDKLLSFQSDGSKMAVVY